MDLLYQSTLKGIVALSYDYYGDREVIDRPDLFKFIWVRSGVLKLEIDHAPVDLAADEIVPLTPFQHLDFHDSDECSYVILVFNTNFYCIYGHDSEVSCSGLLFHGGESTVTLSLDTDHSAELDEVLSNMKREFGSADNLQDEMLRILLKRFIITCTRLARQHFNVTIEKERAFDLVRQFYVLVDNNFRTKKRVQEYADMIGRSPKTLTNLFASYGLPSPLRVIRERVAAEAKRLLLYSHRSSKEIADILGFDDQATFSRFFKSHTGASVTEYLKSAAESNEG
jgi:AraC family transcriptional activator of pobA